jgi:ribosomal protein S27E
MSQSQISQFSDNYPSSLHEDTPLDSFTFLPSDSALSFTPDALYGQQTPTSVPDIEFAPPSAPLPLPDTLKRVGPSEKQKNFILWTEEMNDEFCIWWLKTEFGSQMKRNIFEKQRQAECWKHFHQVATIHDGAPKVMCKVCSQILVHPAVGHRGTTTLNKHFSQGVNCRKAKPGQDIRKLIQAGVYQPIYPYFFLLYLLKSIHPRHNRPLKRPSLPSRPG